MYIIEGCAPQAELSLGKSSRPLVELYFFNRTGKCSFLLRHAMVTYAHRVYSHYLATTPAGGANIITDNNQIHGNWLAHHWPGMVQKECAVEDAQSGLEQFINSHE